MVATLIAVLGISGYVFLDLMQINFEYIEETKIVIGVAVLVSLLKLFKDIVVLRARVIKHLTLLQKAETVLNTQTDIIKTQSKLISNKEVKQ